VGFVSGPLIPASLRGTRNGGLAHACDWYRTIGELAHLNPADSPTAIDSHSLVGMLFSQSPSPRTVIVHESKPGSVNGTAASGKIRAGDWNLYLGTPGYGGYPRPGQSEAVAGDPTPNACSEAPCLFNVSAEGDFREEHDVPPPSHNYPDRNSGLTEIYPYNVF